MAGFTGFTRLALLRARAHRSLLAAALLTVLLTTAVLAALTAYSGALGDAALRHSLAEPRNAADASLVVKADVPAAGRAAADTAVRRGARRAFDGLPVTVRTLVRSGPYALPRPPAARGSDDPDLTHFAALDPAQVRLTGGRLPRAGAAGDVEVAVPQTAARLLDLRPGARLTLADRLGGPPVRVLVTGLYRPADAGAPYWRLAARWTAAGAAWQAQLDRADLRGAGNCATRHGGAAVARRRLLSPGIDLTTIALADAPSPLTPPHPEVLLADEPTGELDSHTAQQIFAAFRTANEELGTTIVIVTHDQTVASEVRRTVAIRDGRTSTEVLRRSEVDETTGHERVVAREYAMLDRAGRLQLPAEYTRALGMRDRVALELEPDHIAVRPDEENS
ncbi:hypothetical protein AB0G64_02580 [Streptomyces longwoodensis]|uniref:hypothetical protein n=1 Tax=Streptomyces longwoodensis TaxID=68231 RepID=UPI0033E50739